jgi:uroporphyrinogen decarboxylase
MTHRERAMITLNRRVPDYIPTFELVFDETERDFEGRTWIGGPVDPDTTGMTFTDKVKYNARLYVDVARRFNHSIIFVNRDMGIHENHEHSGVRDIIQEIRALSGAEFMVMCHNDPTFMIPFSNAEQFYFDILEKPQFMHQCAARNVEDSFRRCHEMLQAGADGFILCCDYCFNSGPFISPAQFSEFIAPYLKEATQYFREQGAYVIKHTDGNIMPIIDDLIDSGPHALHSLDPMAGVDIKVVKERFGDRVALCGNVDCSLMQVGTDEQIAASARYCLEHAKPGGGYIFSTSNCVFRGMPLRSYELIQEIWMENRNY